MANTLRIKRRITGAPGAPGALKNAELAYNEVDNVLYYGKGDAGDGSATSIIQIAGSGVFATKSYVDSAIASADLTSYAKLGANNTWSAGYTNTFNGTTNLVGAFQIGGTAVTSSAAELNLLDGSVANTVVNSKAVIYGSAGEIAASSVTASGSGAFGSLSVNSQISLESDGYIGTNGSVSAEGTGSFIGGLNAGYAGYAGSSNYNFTVDGSGNVSTTGSGTFGTLSVGSGNFFVDGSGNVSTTGSGTFANISASNAGNISIGDGTNNYPQTVMSAGAFSINYGGQNYFFVDGAVGNVSAVGTGTFANISASNAGNISIGDGTNNYPQTVMSAGAFSINYGGQNYFFVDGAVGNVSAVGTGTFGSLIATTTLNVGSYSGGGLFALSNSGFDFYTSNSTPSVFSVTPAGNVTASGTGTFSTLSAAGGNFSVATNGGIEALGGDVNIYFDGNGSPVVDCGAGLISSNYLTTFSDANIGGNLVVTGETSLNSRIVTIGGITANASDDNRDRGVQFRWHNGTSAQTGFFGYDDSTAKFTFIPSATNTNGVFSGTLGTIDVGAVHINGSQIAASNLSNGVTGSGSVVLATSPTLTTPNIGTPSAGTLTNCTGLPVGTGISGLGTGVATFLATPSSANLSAALTDETGSNTVVFSTSPQFTTSVTTNSASFDVFNTTATTVNAFGAATTLNIGALSGATTSILSPNVNIGNNSFPANGTINIGTNAPAANNRTINIGTGAQTSSTANINIGTAARGTTTVNNNLVVSGDLTINGTTTTLNTNTLSVDDKEIEMGAVASGGVGGATVTAGSAVVTNLASTANIIPGSLVSGFLAGGGTVTVPANTTVASVDSATQITLSAALTGSGTASLAVLNIGGPTDVTANGGGIRLKGTTDKTINWLSAANAWTSSEDFNLVTGKVYEINGTSVLSATALGSGVVSSSLTSVGTITAGTWNGTTIAVANGGTGATTAENARTNLGVAYGSTAGTVCQGNDARLSDQRTPTNGSVTAAKIAANQTVQFSAVEISGGSGMGAYFNLVATPLTIWTAGYADTAFIVQASGAVSKGVWQGTAVGVAYGGTGATTAAGARTNLGLVIGTDVQAYDAELNALAGLTSAADALPYFTGLGTASTTTLSSFGRTLIDDADAATARTTLGLVIGTNVQAQDAELAAIAGLTSAADRLPYFTGLGTAALATFTSFGRSLADDVDAAAGRTTLGLGSMATQSASSVAITGGTIDNVVLDGGTF